MTQPSHDVEVSPLEELQAQGQDRGRLRPGPPRPQLRHRRRRAEGDRLRRAGRHAPARRSPPLTLEAEHMLDFEAMKAVPDQLVSYFFWAEDIGPDGQPRRASGDMFFAEVRPFEEIFRQGEQPPGGSAESRARRAAERPAGRPARRAPEADHQRHLEADPPRDPSEADRRVRRGRQDPPRVAEGRDRAGRPARRSGSATRPRRPASSRPRSS